MGTRAKEHDVRAIIDIDEDITNIQPFIKTANILVTEHLGTSTLSDDHLKQIEIWLSAHFIAIRDPRVKQTKIGDAQDTYQGTIGIGKALDATYYGQQVKILDTTGTLQNVGKTPAILTSLEPDS